jgi:protein-tyrosine phosphatase
MHAMSLIRRKLAYRMSRTKLAILFVCTGNICRSPTAHAVFMHCVKQAGLEDEIAVDSAGTHGYHAGDPPDPRSIEAAARRGYELSSLRARRLVRQDFERFDLVLVADSGHRAHVARLIKPSQGHKLRKILDYSRRYRGMDVPDPYYGGPQGFDLVLDMLEDAAEGLLEALATRDDPGRSATSPPAPAAR